MISLLIIFLLVAIVFSFLCSLWEALLADAADLAQVDASVARSLPVLFGKFGDSLNYDKLKHESWKKGIKHRVGFF